MRRVLLAATFLLPTLAFAQSTPAEGNITADATSISVPQCSGTKELDMAIQDDMALLWSTKLASGTFPTGGTYQLYAANGKTSAGDGTDVDCSVVVSGGDNTTFHDDKVGDSFTATQQVWTTPKDFSRLEMVSSSQFDCTEDHTVYLCMQLLDGTTRVGWATTTVTISTKRPAAPTAVKAEGGDGNLHVSWGAGTGGAVDASSYRIKVSSGGALVKWVDSTTKSNIIDGLTNNTTYDVAVYALSAVGNPSIDAGTAQGTPQPAADFWDEYKYEGGNETGGCSTGATGLFALLGAAGALFVTRRRKS